MKLKQLAPNMTELEINGWHILFSYETPVAAMDISGMCYKTNKFYSKTTTKHINKWGEFGGYQSEKDPQFFESILRNIK